MVEENAGALIERPEHPRKVAKCIVICIDDRAAQLRALRWLLSGPAPTEERKAA